MERGGEEGRRGREGGGEGKGGIKGPSKSKETKGTEEIR